LGNICRAITFKVQITHLVRANAVIKACLPHANKSIRIGITVPGVGKVRSLRRLKAFNWIGQKKVSAVDPSSTICTAFGR
jgi:LAO/AO transport system kinase